MCNIFGVNLGVFSLMQGSYNGLLRQFFPKQMALDKVSEKETFRATDLMNNKPRKCLGWKTLFEVFAQLTGKDYFLNGSVALMG